MVEQTTTVREIGPEDPRVFTWGKEEYLLFNDVPRSSVESKKIIRGMRMQVIRAAFSAVNQYRLHCPKRIFPTPGPVMELQVPNHQRLEKNFSPIGELDGSYLFR